MTSDKKERVGNGDGASVMLDMYAILGHDLLYEAGESAGSSGADAVSVKIGDFLEMSGCYIESLGVDFSNTYDAEGFPTLLFVRLRLSLWMWRMLRMMVTLWRVG